MGNLCLLRTLDTTNLDFSFSAVYISPDSSDLHFHTAGPRTLTTHICQSHNPLSTYLLTLPRIYPRLLPPTRQNHNTEIPTASSPPRILPSLYHHHPLTLPKINTPRKAFPYPHSASWSYSWSGRDWVGKRTCLAFCRIACVVGRCVAWLMGVIGGRGLGRVVRRGIFRVGGGRVPDWCSLRTLISGIRSTGFTSFLP
ncbi:hypothetical protein DL98DRAFT_129457 [Cadophora sp. DSE1049]|nr:hypothetical protein DL98DRAFT_129457 [Cadophora sp. DSE1049]